MAHRPPRVINDYLVTYGLLSPESTLFYAHAVQTVTAWCAGVHGINCSFTRRVIVYNASINVGESY